MKSRGRVLIVEDDPLVARALKRLLRGDHDLVHAADGVDALEQIEAGHQFDLILCDIQLPRMTGTEFYRRLVEVAPALSDRLIFVTGAANHPLARAASASFIVEKPFAPNEFSKFVRRVVSAAQTGYFPRPT